jgi:hypothetical protein
MSVVTYAARDREFAARICRSAADNQRSLAREHAEATGDADLSDTWTLAHQARITASRLMSGAVTDDDKRYFISCAIAEQMLIDGWCPGEPVERLGLSTPAEVIAKLKAAGSP